MASLGGSSGYLGIPGPQSSPAGPPGVIAGRYQRGDRLGAGSFGQVVRATDLLTRGQVAVKLFDRTIMAARVRREVVALRALRLPGVVRLLDEGVDDGWPFLVMELIEGQPFPHRAEPISWPALEPAATSLLEVLGRVHQAGALHLDLKPPNVMVTAHGAVVLLDLGLAGGAALGGANPAELGAGTAAFMAPEQIRSGRASARSDLFAAGVMLYRALAGRYPYQRQLDAGQVHEPDREAAPLAHHAPAVPAPVCAVIDAMLARRPDARPASAWGVLAQLDRARAPHHRAWAPRLPHTGEHLSPEALARCFHGPERLLHLPGDAAEQLYRRTGGARARVHTELQAWLRLGLATVQGQQLCVTRAAIDQLASLPGSGRAPAHSADQDDQRLWQLIASGPEHDIAPVAAGVARAHLMRGRRDQARAALEQALLCIRGGDPEAGGEAELLTVWVEMALEQRSPAALDVALYQLGRAVQRTAYSGSLEALIRSALYAERGESARAHAQLQSLPPFSQPALELWRHWVLLRLAAKRGPAAHAAALAAAHAWAEPCASADIQARLLDWRGRLAYEQHAFVQAAELQARAAALTRRCSDRLSCLLNSGSAYMEAGNYAAARALAEQALAVAAQSRLAHFEGRAEWLLRAIAYRSGAAREPDLELIDAAAHLDIDYLQGLICLSEAAIAWRYGDLQETGYVAARLAARARERFHAATLRAGVVLAHALELACTPAEKLCAGELAALAHDVIEQPLPDVDWQVLGMLACLPGGSGWQERAIALASAAPHPELRRELLAPREVVESRREARPPRSPASTL